MLATTDPRRPIRLSAEDVAPDAVLCLDSEDAQARHLDLVSRELAILVEAMPESLEAARGVLADAPDAPWAQQWAVLLDAGLDAVVAVLRSGSDAGRELRGASPLAKVIEVPDHRLAELERLAD